MSSSHQHQIILVTQEGATFQQQQKQHTGSHTPRPCNTPPLIHRPKPIAATGSSKSLVPQPKPHADRHGRRNQHQRCALLTSPIGGLHPTLAHTFSRETIKQSSQHKISRQLYITRPSPLEPLALQPLLTSAKFLSYTQGFCWTKYVIIKVTNVNQFLQPSN